MVEIGPNLTSVLIALISLGVAAVGIWRGVQLAALHAATQQQVDRNETPAQARKTEEIRGGKG